MNKIHSNTPQGEPESGDDNLTAPLLGSEAVVNPAVSVAERGWNVSSLRAEVEESHSDLILPSDTLAGKLPPLNRQQVFDRSLRVARERLAKAERDEILPIDGSVKLEVVSLENASAEMFIVPGLRKYPSLLSPDMQGTSCQDAAAIRQTDDLIVGTLADGVSEIPLARYGAGILAERVSEIAHSVFRGCESVRDPKLHAELYTQLYFCADELAREVGMTPASAVPLFLCTTLQIGIVSPRETILLALADGYIAGKHGPVPMNLLVDRPEEFSHMNIPPLLMCALDEDYFRQGLPWREWRKLCLAHFDSLSLSERDRSEQELNLYARQKYHQEALGLFVVYYAPTAQIPAGELLHFSDGIRFCDVLSDEQDGMVHFPYQHLVEVRDLALLEDLIALWNCGADYGDAPWEAPYVRLQSIAQLLNLVILEERLEESLWFPVIAEVVGISTENLTGDALRLAAVDIVRQGQEGSGYVFSTESRLNELSELLRVAIRGFLGRYFADQPGDEPLAVARLFESGIPLAPFWDDLALQRIRL